MRSALQASCRCSAAGRWAAAVNSTTTCHFSVTAGELVMYRAPKTVLDFFKPKPASHSQDQSRKRNSSEALHEIQVNGGASAKRIKPEPGEPPSTRRLTDAMLS